MITPTTLPTFPACPTFGFTSRPVYLVKKVSREGGYERRDLKWQEPLLVYEGVPMGRKRQAEIEAVLKFYHAMHGEFVRFRFKDWTDYKSCDLDDEPSATDQPLVSTAGSPGGYRIAKVYEDTSYQTVRQNLLPVGSTIRVANQLGVEQASSTWTVEEDTGLIVPTGGFSGTPTTWGGEFYVPVRFEGPQEFVIESHKIQSCTVTLQELRREP